VSSLSTTPAALVLASGEVFQGLGFGAQGISVGEVVFNTALSGYQEILTDPSYARQLVTLTYPHIGNTGTNSQDEESNGIFAAGLIVRDVPRRASNWRNTEDLPAYLKRHNRIGLAEIDTRSLTRLLRERGAQNAALVCGENLDLHAARTAAQAFAGLQGLDLAKVVSTSTKYEWRAGSFDLDKCAFAAPTTNLHVVAYDFGIKRNILRLLADRGCAVTVVPAQTTADDVLALNPDGVFLSNGPGDPAPCDYAITAIKHFIAIKLPLFGICLGHQLLGLASGAATRKMKFGHHGANHPVIDLASGRVMISSQNHGFAVDEESLPSHVRPTHRSLFDGSLQGIELLDAPAYSFQGHPEASPGPNDVAPLFDRFVGAMRAGKNKKSAA
jgi:carbamoyl-phosphate synthase small subunit